MSSKISHRPTTRPTQGGEHHDPNAPARCLLACAAALLLALFPPPAGGAIGGVEVVFLEQSNTYNLARVSPSGNAAAEADWATLKGMYDFTSSRFGLSLANLAGVNDDYFLALANDTGVAGTALFAYR